MLWRDAIIGWANVAVEASAVGGTVGFVAGHAPRDRAFGRELERELARMRTFLGL
jgi:uroporphyrinogen-III decarboxylase